MRGYRFNPDPGLVVRLRNAPPCPNRGQNDCTVYMRYYAQITARMLAHEPLCPSPRPDCLTNPRPDCLRMRHHAQSAARPTMHAPPSPNAARPAAQVISSIISLYLKVDNVISARRVSIPVKLHCFVLVVELDRLEVLLGAHKAQQCELPLIKERLTALNKFTELGMR